MAGRNWPQNPAHSEWAPIRGIPGEGSVAGELLSEVVGLCPGTVPLELRRVCVCSFWFLVFGGLTGRRSGSPYYDGYSGVGQEKGDVKIILLLPWPFGLHVVG